jgi:hypothetical protein
LGFSGSDKEEILANPEGCFLADLNCESQAKARLGARYFVLFFKDLLAFSEASSRPATIRAIAPKSG